MEPRTVRLVERLARQVARLPPPIHLLWVWSGGQSVTRLMARHLRTRGIPTRTFYVRNRCENGHCELRDTDFRAKDYTGTAVIVEDAIWTGKNIPPIRQRLRAIRPGRKVYVAALLDYNKRADFSVFR
jgi:hypothetical protein